MATRHWAINWTSLAWEALRSRQPAPVRLNSLSCHLNSVADFNDLQAADFVLAKLTFDAIGAGTSSLTFSGVTLGDANGDPLTADLGTGSVTVESAVTASIPEPSTMILLALGVWLMAWNRRRLFRDKNLSR